MNSGQGLQEFKNEVVLLLAKLQHRNLVGLLGCCIQGEKCMLIYEYMSNRNLDNFIFGLFLTLSLFDSVLFEHWGKNNTSKIS